MESESSLLNESNKSIVLRIIEDQGVAEVAPECVALLAASFEREVTAAR
jgi:hypothetical protein